MEFLSGFGHALLFGALNMAWIFIVLWGIERLWPRGEQATITQRLKALKFWTVYLVTGAVIGVALGALIGKPQPLYMIPVERWLTGSWLLYILGPLAFAALYDFFNYWMHRAQHKWFWKLHAVHHSIENISGLNSYFHWTEHLFRVVFITLPMAYVLGLDPGKSAVAASLLTTIHGNFIHSSTKLNLGPLSYLIVDNRWHRIHHSREAEHFDKNFGTAITLWDHLFGTAHIPRKDEWPDTGVHDIPESRGRDILWPQARGKAAVGAVKAAV